MTNLSHNASFHSNERIAPSNRGIKHLVSIVLVIWRADCPPVGFWIQLTAEAEFGKRAFEAKCADCHGENAAGQNGVAPPLVHKIYEPSHHSDMAFVLAAKNGVRAHHWKFGNMPPVKGLTQADVKYIARYVRELQRENGIN